MKLRLDGFRPEFLDFQRGIRVGHLEPHERITQILKLSLEERYRQTFVTDRWGRGVYWQWICFLPKANRLAKPVSSHVNFGCSKYFIMVDREEARFKAGLQIERGLVDSEPHPGCQLRDDWDWNRLVAGIKDGGPLFKELRRLTGEDFEIQAGSWELPNRFSEANMPAASRLAAMLNSMPPDRWGAFQLFYPMTAEEVRESTGQDLVEAMLAIFEEVTPAMNECMQIQLEVKETSAV
ncbi:MAG: hypothetical protein EHM23_21150 [Acidobacteria bacterium]|nr:MAG: hypothetical protein EHM23_21150 [Acidobacteriota bacterium]